MKRIAAIMLTLLPAFISFAQKPLTPEAQKVKDAYDWLLKQPNLPENQLHFIESFPDTKDYYIEVFTPHTFDQLYFNYEAYVSKYRELSKMYPKQVMIKSITISKQLHTSKGPAAIMQETIMETANISPKAFAVVVNKLKKKEQISLVQFLADVPDHNNYPQYQTLIKKLEDNGDTKIADLMIEARDQRMKQ